MLNVRELLDALSNVGIIQHIHATEVGTRFLKDSDDACRKSAHGHGWIAFHIQHDGIRFDVFLNAK
jgi:hypothetical protein